MESDLVTKIEPFEDDVAEENPPHLSPIGPFEEDVAEENLQLD